MRQRHEDRGQAQAKSARGKTVLLCLVCWFTDLAALFNAANKSVQSEQEQRVSPRKKKTEVKPVS